MPNESTQSPTPRAAAQQALQGLLTDRPIAYHPLLARALGSATAGIFLSQLLYWMPRSSEPAGWVWKTQPEIAAETALTRSEQETARKTLRSTGVLEEKRAGVPARLYFRVNMQRLTELLAKQAASGEAQSAQEPADAPREPVAERKFQFAGIQQSSLRESSKLVGGKAANKNAGIPQSISETTSEITSIIITDDVVSELMAFGIEADIARQLAHSYEASYIRDRVDRIRYLMATNPSAIRKTPQAFLVASLKHPGIDPAPGYKTPQQQQAATQAKAEAAKKAQALVAAEQARAEQERAAEREKFAQALADVRRRHPAVTIPATPFTTQTAWNMVLSRLRMALAPADYAAWLSQTIFVSCDGATGILAAQNGFCAQWLHKRFDKLIRQELEEVLGFPVRLQYLAVSDLRTDASVAEPPSRADSSPQQSSDEDPNNPRDRGGTLFDHALDVRN